MCCRTNSHVTNGTSQELVHLPVHVDALQHQSVLDKLLLAYHILDDEQQVKPAPDEVHEHLGPPPHTIAVGVHKTHPVVLDGQGCIAVQLDVLQPVVQINLQQHRTNGNQPGAVDNNSTINDMLTT